jgi:hypothetical protein
LLGGNPRSSRESSPLLAEIKSPANGQKQSFADKIAVEAKVEQHNTCHFSFNLACRP